MHVQRRAFLKTCMSLSCVVTLVPQCNCNDTHVFAVVMTLAQRCVIALVPLCTLTTHILWPCVVTLAPRCVSFVVHEL